MTINKSWTVTIASIIIAVVMIILPSFGVTGIEEVQIEHLVYMALGISAIGAGNKGVKHIAQKLKPNLENSVDAVRNSLKPNQIITKPRLGPIGAKYQTNFVKNDEKGNVLPRGSNLWIKRVGVRSYLSAVLYDANMNVIQIDQSHEHDEDGDIETTRLETFNLQRGKYYITSQGDAGSSDSTGIRKDRFYIV